jgi:hypothetical protein
MAVWGQPGHTVWKTPSPITRSKWTGGVDQAAECLLCKWEHLNSNHSPTHPPPKKSQNIYGHTKTHKYPKPSWTKIIMQEAYHYILHSCNQNSVALGWRYGSSGTVSSWQAQRPVFKLQSHLNKTKNPCYWHKDRCTDQSNRITSFKENPCTYSQLIFNKSAKGMYWRKDSLFNKWKIEYSHVEEWN